MTDKGPRWRVEWVRWGGPAGTIEHREAAEFSDHADAIRCCDRLIVRGESLCPVIVKLPAEGETGGDR